MTNPKWEIGPVKLANGTEGHIDFVSDCSKSIAYTGRFKTYNGDWWAMHWDESGRVPNSCEGYGHNLAPPPKKTVLTKTMWMVVRDNGEAEIFYNQKTAREVFDGLQAFAIRKIEPFEVTEGEGL